MSAEAGRKIEAFIVALESRPQPPTLYESFHILRAISAYRSSLVNLASADFGNAVRIPTKAQLFALPPTAEALSAAELRQRWNVISRDLQRL